MGEFRMPSLGADMESGTVLEWYVKPGDTVKRGDIVALVDTSKAEIEVEIFEDGVIGEVLVPAGERVPVGTVMATLLPLGGDVEPPPAVPEPVLTAAAPTSTNHHLRVSPLARRMAQELGVDVAGLSGSGAGGAIIRADVEAAAAPVPTQAPAPPISLPAVPARRDVTPVAPAAAPEARAEEPDRHAAMRAAIGALMARSKREIPHYYLQLDIDLSRALEWLHDTNTARPVTERLLPSALLLAAVAHAAAQTPEMNGFWLEDGFHPAEAVHLGVAVSLRGGGLIAPALHDAAHKSLDEIMRATHDLVARARAGRLRSSEMSEPTITVTNLGDRGVDLVHGVIYPPQVALVGFGAVHERPWAQDGMLGVRPVVTATLAGDHRASDGHAGGRFLERIARHLQTPEEL